MKIYIIVNSYIGRSDYEFIYTNRYYLNGEEVSITKPTTVLNLSPTDNFYVNDTGVNSCLVVSNNKVVGVVTSSVDTRPKFEWGNDYYIFDSYGYNSIIGISRPFPNSCKVTLTTNKPLSLTVDGIDFGMTSVGDIIYVPYGSVVELTDEGASSVDFSSIPTDWIFLQDAVGNTIGMVVTTNGEVVTY